jgi:2-desacetyl-2-hydroxyethyl bacteriochlorophyllide A dehydrogenase
MNVIGVHSDGGMGEYLTIPVSHLYRSDRASLEELALVEPLGIGAHAVERANLDAEDHVLIIGVGPIGLAVLQFACLAGLKPTVLDTSAHRLQFCRQHFPLQRAVDRLDAEDRFSVVFDATGSLRSMEQSFDRVAHGGRLVFVGHIPDRIGFSDAEFHKRELTLLASRNTTPEQFTRIVQLIETRRIQLKPWITARVSLRDLPATFQQICDPAQRNIKSLVVVE